jgi:cell division protein FtsQ
MLKRINWKAIGYTFIWLVCLSGLVVLMSFIEGKKQAVVCTQVKVLIPGNRSFIERKEVDNIVATSEGQLVGRELKSINIHRLENALRANPFIEFAKVYADMDGVIRIQIRQREPIVRVINSASQDYYIDRNGLKIPVSPNFTARVLVANGNILEGFAGDVDTLSTKLAKDIFKTALYIAQDTLWNEQIEQLFVNAKSDIEMIPRVGNQKIILGNADSLETKFGNLLAFYKKAMPKVGWDTYKTINIKYANQVVCEKNIIDSNKLAKPAAVPDSLAKKEINTLTTDTTTTN